MSCIVAKQPILIGKHLYVYNYVTCSVPLYCLSS